ncbi:MAG: hypothetical protein ABIB79_03270 [archaeon]
MHHWLNKIELVIVGLLLVFHILFLYTHPEIVSETFFPESFQEKPRAPSDFISEDEILVYPDKLVLNIENYKISRYAPTKSMVPVLDSGANGIGVKPKSAESLNIGDIITFRDGEDLIVHRIVDKGTDDEGMYFITKGDNNTITDGKVRFEQVDTVLVALIY